MFEHETALLISEPGLDPRVSPRLGKMIKAEIKSVLCVPLRISAKIIGAIEVINTEDKFSPSHLQFLQALADLAGLAAEKIYLQSKLREQARLDPLTKVYNRFYFEQLLAKEIARSQRYNFPLSLILLDIEAFKKINEEYGHQAGDNLLKTLARLLSNQVRKVDTVFRIGEDEFALLLPHTGEEGAQHVRQRIEHALEEAQAQKKILPIRINFGLYSAAGAEEAKDLFARADINLFHHRHGDVSEDMIANQEFYQLILPFMEEEEKFR